MKPFDSFALAMAALAALLTAAQADPLAELRAFFPQGQPVCFARVFDAAFLQANPQQSVTAIRLVHGFPQLRFEDETSLSPGEPPPTPEQAAQDYRAVTAQIIVTFRDSGQKAGPKRYAAMVNCRPNADAGKVRCGIDCDGGGFLLERSSSGGIRMTLEDGFNLRLAGGCTSHRAYRGLGRESGDRDFSLAPAPMASCR